MTCPLLVVDIFLLKFCARKSAVSMPAVALADQMYPKMADIVENKAFRGKEPGKTKTKS